MCANYLDLSLAKIAEVSCVLRTPCKKPDFTFSCKTLNLRFSCQNIDYGSRWILKIKISARNLKIKILAQIVKIRILVRNLKIKVNLRFRFNKNYGSSPVALKDKHIHMYLFCFRRCRWCVAAADVNFLLYV